MTAFSHLSHIANLSIFMLKSHNGYSLLFCITSIHLFLTNQYMLCIKIHSFIVLQASALWLKSICPCLCYGYILQRTQQLPRLLNPFCAPSPKTKIHFATKELRKDQLGSSFGQALGRKYQGSVISYFTALFAYVPYGCRSELGSNSLPFNVSEGKPQMVLNHAVHPCSVHADPFLARVQQCYVNSYQSGTSVTLQQQQLLLLRSAWQVIMVNKKRKASSLGECSSSRGRYLSEMTGRVQSFHSSIVGSFRSTDSSSTI